MVPPTPDLPPSARFNFDIEAWSINGLIVGMLIGLIDESLICAACWMAVSHPECSPSPCSASQVRAGGKSQLEPTPEFFGPSVALGCVAFFRGPLWEASLLHSVRYYGRCRSQPCKVRSSDCSSARYLLLWKGCRLPR